MKVGFIQMNPVFGEKRLNVENALKLARKIESDLYVLPELFNTGYAFTSRDEALELAEEIPGQTTEKLAEYCRENDVYIVGGIAERENGRVYNSAVAVGPDGLIGKYRKSHLFYAEKKWFSPGDTGFRVFTLKKLKVKIGIIICFDWVFPEASRVLALKGADIICHPSNLVLPYAQKAMLTRSFENKVFTVTANRVGSEKRGGYKFLFTGLSQVTNPKMEILVQASRDREEVKVVEIDVEEARNKKITEFNDLFLDRRVDLYREILG